MSLHNLQQITACIALLQRVLAFRCV